MTRAESIAAFGRMHAAGLLDRDECLAAILGAANYPSNTTDLERIFDDASKTHESTIMQRVRIAIASLIACRACTAAVHAQARFANNARGRINSLPDAEITNMVQSELAAALQRIRRSA